MLLELLFRAIVSFIVNVFRVIPNVIIVGVTTEVLVGVWRGKKGGKESV